MMLLAKYLWKKSWPGMRLAKQTKQIQKHSTTRRLWPLWLGTKKSTALATPQTLQRLRKAIRNKRRGILTFEVVLIHYNDPPHTDGVTKCLLWFFPWDIFDHPAHIPNLAPSDSSVSWTEGAAERAGVPEVKSFKTPSIPISRH